MDRPNTDTVTDPAELLAGVEASLAAVDDALRRLDDGRYGRCTDCGEPLPATVLESDPLAVRCPTCSPA